MKSSKKFIFPAIFATLFAASFILLSCQKEKTNPSTTDFQTSAEDIGQMESIFTDIDNLVAEASVNGAVNGRYSNPQDANSFVLNACAVVTNDSINGVLTIDFGTGCTGPNGRTRSGIIQINYSGGHYFDPGSSRTVTFINYYVDGIHIEGTRSTVNNGFNTAGNMNWTITATNMRVTRPNGSWQGWNDQRNREMTAGFGDSLWSNDTYLINGNGSGANSHGDSCTSVLTNLVRDNSCQWLVSGTIENTPSSRPARTIDFGNGTCDALATVTVNGNTTTIHLRP